MSAFLFYFRDTERDASNSRARIRERVGEGRARHRARQEEWRRQHGGQSQVKALPGVLAYFVRTVQMLQMLQGLCTLLQASVPLLKPMAACAERTLLEHAKAHPRARSLRLMHALVATGELLGAQLCLMLDGRRVVDVACGCMGPVDPRPVEQSSLFQVFEAGSAVIASLVLQEVGRNKLGLLDPIASVWPEFGAGGKGSMSLATLLNHTSGLEATLPSSAKMSQLCDTPAMSAHVASSSPATRQQPPPSPIPPRVRSTFSAPISPHHPRTGGWAALRAASPADLPTPAVSPHGRSASEGGGGGLAEYEGAPWGWTMAGLLRRVGGGDLPDLIARRVCRPLGIPPSDLCLSAGAAADDRVVRFTARACGGQAAVAQLLSAVTEGRGGGGGGGEGEGALDLSAAQQLSNHASFNMRQLRRAGIASTHLSA
ncbi:MAG: hypothetical protein SGPRY_005832 [Prymnesium sp.]